jgi:hypothetical protein
MSFLTPWIAVFAGLAVIPPLVALYFLKRRRQSVMVSSSLLWRKAIDDLQVNAPFQRLRKNLLLILQLLILFALLFALARPTVQGTADTGERVVILIDQSASMNARDVSPTRLDEAKQQALRIVESMDVPDDSDIVSLDGPQAGAMVISFADSASVRQPFTTDRARLRDAINSITATDGGTQLNGALRLIEPFAQAGAADSAEQGLLHVYVISDGRLQQQPETTLPGTKVTFIRLGQPADAAERRGNTGIVALAARRDFSNPEEVHIFARVTNDRLQPFDANVMLKLDGVSQRAIPVKLGPAAAGTGEAGSANIETSLAVPTSGLIELQISQDDDLMADNYAAAVVPAPRRLGLLLVTRGDTLLQQVLAAIGAGEVHLLTPDQYEQRPAAQYRRGWVGQEPPVGGEGYDVIVFDGHSPSAVPAVSSLYLGSSPPIDGLRLIEPTDREPGSRVVLNWDRQHPLLRYVEMDSLRMAGAGRLVLPADAQALATGQAGAVMAVVADEQRQHVVLTFDVLQTNWPLQVSFPIFFSNAVPWLGLGGKADEGLSYRPGDVTVVDTTSDAMLRYAGPEPLLAKPVGGEAVLPIFARAGLYRAENREQLIDASQQYLPVNVVNPTDSDLRPVSAMDLGGASLVVAERDAVVRREVWRWFAWGALAVLLIEWIVYTRRMHL